MSPDDAARVAAAIKAAEAGTDGEIAAIVAADSDTYADAVLHWSFLFALLPLAIAAAFPALLIRMVTPLFGWDVPSLGLLLTAMLIAAIILFLVVHRLIGSTRLRIALTPASTRHRRVRRRAILLFKAAIEGRTRSATGVLLYLSLAERRAEIVADAAIHARAPQEAWGEAMAVLIGALRDDRPGEGMAAAIERIGGVLAEHFPFTGSDPNELPDRLVEL